MKPVYLKSSIRLLAAGFCLISGLCLMTGCASRYVQATIENHTDAPLRLIEVDYPSASFGTSQLAPHAVFHYRFKVQGSGAVTMSFTGATGQARNAIGLELAEGEQGSLGISIEPGDRVRWATDLSVKR
jgi:hypothetical protein